MKKTVAIQISAEKYSALMMYLEQKNLSLEDELSKQAEVIYQRVVPQNVREFIEMKSGEKADRKPQKAANKVSVNHSEQ